MDPKPHIVALVTKYSDGTETVVNYHPSDQVSEEVVAEVSVPEFSVEEAVEVPEVAEEAITESVEEAVEL